MSKPNSIPKLIPSDTPRFWSKVAKGKPDECWLWMGALRNPNKETDYGVFIIRKFGNFAAHRIAWVLTFGEIPDDLLVLHECDNPRCCNPKHLSLGTQSKNISDCVERGRGNTGNKNWTRHSPEKLLKGEENHFSKLTEDIVKEIRASQDRNYGYLSRLGKQFGISHVHVSRILKREVWKHI